jgi:hypothetical protein
MGFYDVAFPSNASNLCLLQAVIPSYIHCSNVSLCHTPRLEFQGPPPDGKKIQYTEFSLTDARMIYNGHD